MRLTIVQAVLVLLLTRPPAPLDWYAEMLMDPRKLRFAGRR